jgi:hypothetical protein
MGFNGGFNPFKKVTGRDAAIAVGAVAALGGAAEVGHLAQKSADDMNHAPAAATASMHAEQHNPTIGKTSADAPTAIDIHVAPKVATTLDAHPGVTADIGHVDSVTTDLGHVDSVTANLGRVEKVSIDLHEVKPVTIDLGDKTRSIEMPER